MVRRLVIIGSSILMIMGLITLTWSFRDLPIDERPEWMAWQMVLWPIAAFGVMEVWKLYRYRKSGFIIRVDRFRLLVHGIPSLLVATMPAGAMTTLWGSQTVLALLDFPTAKVMAALWLAYTVWSSWEVVLP
jgi:hypothetical protein